MSETKNLIKIQIATSGVVYEKNINYSFEQNRVLVDIYIYTILYPICID